jgi:hypothetical protein
MGGRVGAAESSDDDFAGAVGEVEEVCVYDAGGLSRAGLQVVHCGVRLRAGPAEAASRTSPNDEAGLVELLQAVRQGMGRPGGSRGQRR